MRLATVVIFITMISGRLALIKTIFKGNRAQTTVALEARGYQEKKRRHWDKQETLKQFVNLSS